MERFVPYGRQYIDDDDVSEVLKVLESDFITQGPRIQEFEEKLAEYCGARYAVALSSGTAALHAAYSALGLAAGDEIITSPITFAATSNAALYTGARPVFVDVEPCTANMDVGLIEGAVTDKTRIIVPVHYGGHPVDLEGACRVARDRGLFMVEDASHALGARYAGERIGCCRHSDITVFSFHPVKHITTAEGGAVLTNSEELYRKVLLFRSHGISRDRFVNSPDGPWYYEMQMLGYNYRMSDLQAALGISQIRKLKGFIERRRLIAETYNNVFRDNPYFDIPVEKDYAFSSYHLYSIRLKDGYKDKRGMVFTRLRQKGVGVQVHYIPVYTQPYYQGLGYEAGACPAAEDFYAREMSIPIHPSMTDDDIGFVVRRILEVFGEIGD